eukprot:TRINITY_DN1439_c0_g2_i2.p1 TRINITY_DN1439_c0_g2~~TRINITY_DN1439_c0_g2_i2.p1  ORF type:complete len:615 (+),score=169.54 TRINITY_DN1439_c0_g2_i2:434-2278(+)
MEDSPRSSASLVPLLPCGGAWVRGRCELHDNYDYDDQGDCLSSQAVTVCPTTAATDHGSRTQSPDAGPSIGVRTPPAAALTASRLHIAAAIATARRRAACAAASPALQDILRAERGGSCTAVSSPGVLVPIGAAAAEEALLEEELRNRAQHAAPDYRYRLWAEHTWLDSDEEDGPSGGDRPADSSGASTGAGTDSDCSSGPDTPLGPTSTAASDGAQGGALCCGAVMLLRALRQEQTGGRQHGPAPGTIPADSCGLLTGGPAAPAQVSVDFGGAVVPVPAAHLEAVASAAQTCGCCGRQLGGVAAEVAQLVQQGHAEFALVGGDCAGGTYFVSDTRTGKRVAVFKPRDEEPAMPGNPKGCTHESHLMKEGFTPGQCWRRELAGSRFDRGFAGVPETVPFAAPAAALGRGDAARGRLVLGSLQRFVTASGEAWDYLPGQYPAVAVHRIALLDLVLLNCDRHGGNMLVRLRDGTVTGLVPIDHGFLLPTSLAELDYEWHLWPQAKLPFGPEERDWAAALDPFGLAANLRSWGIDAEAADLAAAAAFGVKEGTALGLTARQLASFWRRELATAPSQLESVVTRCRTPLQWEDDGGDIDWDMFQRCIAEELAAFARSQ